MAITLNGSSSVVTNSGAVYDGIQRGTAVSASGTSVDFTGIPSWVKRITVMFNGVSTNGTSVYLVQIGAGSVQTSGYVAGVAATTSTAGFPVTNNFTAATTQSGLVSINNITSNTWVSAGIVGASGGNAASPAFGTVSLSGTLDRVRVTTVNGTDTFDAGSINILYE